MIGIMSELEKRYEAAEVLIDETIRILTELKGFSDHPGVINLSEQLVMLEAYRKIIQDTCFDENMSINSRDIETANVVNSLYRSSREMHEIAIEAKLDLLQ